MQEWADEAERCFDVMRLAGRGIGPAQVVPARTYVRAAIRSYLA